ncbi:MAG: cob(I)yrinic acid a,c-diamide adenosyltransferase [bacterium]|nr:cob(I)yrinic acid a,c-diamide adenosyltransferase [bacterium]
MKIYTRTGDDGTTSLFSGGRVAKTDLRVEAYGTVDELNSVLGIARALHPTLQTGIWLAEIQTQLFHLGADLATPLDAASTSVVRIQPDNITWLEDQIDRMTAELPELKNFISPGGTPVAAHLHLARTVCRRAERCALALREHDALNERVLPYLNRLSDFLFTLARWENWQMGVVEEKWAVR